MSLPIRQDIDHLTHSGKTPLTATQAAAEIARGALSAEDYTRACLDRISELEPTIHAFIHLDPDHALAQARALDERRNKGQPIGPLHGIPVGIKDIFDTADYKTECGSPLHKGRQPAHDCAAVARLRAAGAVIIGKTVTTECAYFHPGATRNPHDRERTPGGSSSGSAAAVAAGMVPLAIGSQTNGSVIRPAAFCGVYGVKPSHGTISRHGALILSKALDHVGVFANTLADTALILEVLAGYDENDEDTRPQAPEFRKALAEKPPTSPKLAFVRTPAWDKADADARTAFENLAKRLGLATVDLPDDYKAAWDDQRVIMATDMTHNFGALVERGGDASSKQLRDLVAEGRQTTALRYLAARDNARRYAAGIGDILKQYDAILTPSAPGVAPKGNATGNPAFNTIWTLTGLPAVSLPLLKGEGGMPIGVQLVGAAGDDARLLRTANWLVNKLG
jgi:Asp-tRNA(Asn)/Glu-tRNA(Gln) amidotransferase A subunit family amidase